MDGRGFYRFVNSHPQLEWVGAIEGAAPKDDAVQVHCNDTGHTFELPIIAIREAEQSSLEDVLLGRRPPKIMKHITRIVGYFSEVNNWNRSKRAELDDRHGGDYSVR